MAVAPNLFSSIWLEPAIPFATSLTLLAAGRGLGRRATAWIGAGAIAASTLVAILVATRFASQPPPGHAFTLHLWTWIAISGFRPAFALYLDPLAVVMTLVVTFVSFLIHLYSTEYMETSEGYQRFFGYMNLFVASMLTLVLANNLLLLFFGWEGVGLCSYLLIGFWYGEEANGLAARKALIVTRVGDTAMILGLVLIASRLGTLNLPALMHLAPLHWARGSAVAETAAFLLLGGAVGKSAQLPLQTWLPDAMAGPTPTSALIHAATMVTAGVYLIARTHVLFDLAPAAERTVAIIGVVTLLMAGFSALTQRDIKRILAYSTISQIGYMFLALGVGAWAAAIFHLVTHAFFKALLFLAAGAIIHALNEEHDIFHMGGLRQQMPLTYWCFVFAGSSLAGLPLITAGFYSKGLIIFSAWNSPRGEAWLWIGAVVGAFLTALYIFRLIFVVFHGQPAWQPPQPSGPPLPNATGPRQPHALPGHLPGPRMQWPMIILAYLSMLAGFFDLPPALGGSATLTRFLQPALPVIPGVGRGITEIASEIFVGGVFFLGFYLIYLYQLQKPELSDALLSHSFSRKLRDFWFTGWGMDHLYDRVFVQPVGLAARWDRADEVDRIYRGIAWITNHFYQWLRLTQTGRLRWYVGWVAAGAIALVMIGMLR